MAGLIHIILVLTKASFKDFFIGASKRSKSSLLIFGIAIFFIAPPFNDEIVLSSFRLQLGEVTDAHGLLELWFLGWLTAPFLLRGTAIRSDILSLMRFPLGNHTLFAYTFAEFFTSPLFWLYAFGTFKLGRIFTTGPNPVMGYLSFFLFNWIGLFCSLCLLHLWGYILNARQRNLIIGLVFALGFFLYQARPPIGGYLPADLVMDLQIYKSQTPLILLVVYSLISTFAAYGFFLLYYFDLRDHLGTGNQSGRRPLIGFLPQLPGKLGALVRLSVQFHTRSLAFLVSFLFILGQLYYLLFEDDVSHEAVWFGLCIIGFVMSHLAINAFAAEGKGYVRYRLMPVSGLALLMAKNSSWLFSYLLIGVPISLCAGFRFGLFASFVVLLLSYNLGIGLCALGNVTLTQSVNVAGERASLGKGLAWVYFMGIGYLASLMVLTITLSRENMFIASLTHLGIALVASLAHYFVCKYCGENMPQN